MIRVTCPVCNANGVLVNRKGGLRLHRGRFANPCSGSGQQHLSQVALILEHVERELPAAAADLAQAEVRVVRARKMVAGLELAVQWWGQEGSANA
jgi:hypothetical protein